jgi:hypothetical protein
LPTIGNNSVPHPTDEGPGIHRRLAPWSKTVREVEVLSSQEQRIWEDVQRFWAEEAQEPSRPRLPSPGHREAASREETDLPVAVIVGARIAIVLILFGAVPAGLAVAVTTALGWTVWRNWRRPAGQAEPPTPSTIGNDGTSCPPAVCAVGR